MCQFFCLCVNDTLTQIVTRVPSNASNIKKKNVGIGVLQQFGTTCRVPVFSLKNHSTLPYSIVKVNGSYLKLFPQIFPPPCRGILVPSDLEYCVVLCTVPQLPPPLSALHIFPFTQEKQHFLQKTVSSSCGYREGDSFSHQIFSESKKISI